MSENIPNGTNSEPVHVQVVGRPDPVLTTAQIIKIVVLGFACAILIPIGVLLYVNSHQTDRRLADQRALAKQLADQNEDLVRRLSREQIKSQNRLRKFAFEQCQKGELRDTVIVQQNNALLALLAEVPAASRTLFIDKLVQRLQDTNATLEPEGEPDCTPPPTVSP